MLQLITSRYDDRHWRRKIEKTLSLPQSGVADPVQQQIFMYLKLGLKAFLAEGAIPKKYKELMALAVAFTTQCPYCIEIHSNKARERGASDPEIAEAVLIAAALRAGGAITHGTHAMKGT
jgi:AhpD family alkylhydroperoxidase